MVLITHLLKIVTISLVTQTDTARDSKPITACSCEPILAHPFTQIGWCMHQNEPALSSLMMLFTLL